MPSKKQKSGLAAEDLVAKQYSNLGFKLIEKNFFARVGELDLVFEKKHLLVIVEVKSSQTDFLPRSEIITKKKQNRIVKATKVFMQDKKMSENDFVIRFDVALVQLGDQPKIEILENAFFAV